MIAHRSPSAKLTFGAAGFDGRVMGGNCPGRPLMLGCLTGGMAVRCSPADDVELASSSFGFVI